jgi:hypothetical protein
MEWLLWLLKTFMAKIQTSDLWNELWYVILQSLKNLLIIIIILLPLIYVMTIPIQTHIQLDLVVNRVNFRVAQQPMELGNIKFHSVTVKDFEQITFAPLNAATPVSIRSKAAELLPSVLLETMNPTPTEFGILQNFRVESAAKVTLSTETLQTEHETLVIAIEEAKNNPSVRLLHPTAFRLIPDQCEEVQGFDISNIIGLSRRNPYLTVTGRDQSLKIIFTTPVQKSFPIFQNTISTQELEFIWEDIEQGQRVADTTLLAEGKMSYPEYPKIEPVVVKESSFVLLDKTDEFLVERMEFDAEQRGFKIRLSGLAKQAVVTYPKGFPAQRKDHRLTIAETLGQGSKFVGILLNLLIYLIPIVIGLVAINKVEVLPRQKREIRDSVRSGNKHEEGRHE